MRESLGFETFKQNENRIKFTEAKREFHFGFKVYLLNERCTALNEPERREGEIKLRAWAHGTYDIVICLQQDVGLEGVVARELKSWERLRIEIWSGEPGLQTTHSVTKLHSFSCNHLEEGVVVRFD